jgi:hypothetical protein
MVLNAALCSTFSIVEGRFQGRVIWLVPLFAFLLVVNYFEQMEEGKDNKPINTHTN